MQYFHGVLRFAPLLASGREYPLNSDWINLARLRNTLMQFCDDRITKKAFNRDLSITITVEAPITGAHTLKINY